MESSFLVALWLSETITGPFGVALRRDADEFLIDHFLLFFVLNNNRIMGDSDEIWENNAFMYM